MRRVFQLVALGAVLTFTAAADTVLQFAGLVNPVTGVANGDEVLTYFDGGQDSYLNTGPSDGVYFSSNGETFSNSEAGNGSGSAPFSGDPYGNTALTFVGSPATMDVPAGFTDLSLYYSAASSSPTITIWSGLDGTGTQLALLNLLQNANSSDPACISNPQTFCPFTLATVDFTGVAESVDFTNAIGLVAMDNIDLGSPSPEPGALKMLGLGLACLLVASRRLRKLQQNTGQRLQS